MDPTRLTLWGVLALSFAVVFGLATSMESTLSPPAVPSLEDLARAAVDFRGCDGTSNRVADFWMADASELYRSLTESEAAPEPKPPGYDPQRDGCNVNDFWATRTHGLHSVSGESARDDAAIKLIELSIAAADDEEELD